MKYSTAMLFIVYLLAGFMLLFTGNMYQRSAYLTSANSVSSAVYETANGVTGYFNLRSINERVAEHKERNGPSADHAATGFR